MSGRKDGVPSESTLRLWNGRVLSDWADYNGHMTEHRYLQVFGETTDRLLVLIGVEFDRAAEGTYYTRETHICHLRECRPGTLLETTTEVLGYDAKRLHLYHRLFDSNEWLLATGEHLCIHVARSKACAAHPHLLQRVSELFDAQRLLPKPERSGSVLTRSLTFSRP
jgi:acyl-CoA thioester hydrolase